MPNLDIFIKNKNLLSIRRKDENINKIQLKPVNLAIKEEDAYGLLFAFFVSFSFSHNLLIIYLSY